MGRVRTTNYLGNAATQFQWATSDNDKFNRELDLYYLSQALELHDHAAGRGLAVTRISANSVDSQAIQAGAVNSTHIQDGSIQRIDLMNGQVDDSKLDLPRVYRQGDTMIGDLRMNRSGNSNTGYVFFGSGNTYMGFDGSRMIWNCDTGGTNLMLGDVNIYRVAPNTHQGAIFLGGGGHYLHYDGTRFVLDGNQIWTDAYNGAVVPLGGIVMFRTQAELTNAGARWVRDTNFDGRLPVGMGGDRGDGNPFTPNQQYGTNWTPTSGLGVNKGTLAVAGLQVGTATASGGTANVAAGGMGVEPRDHTHPVVGTGNPNSISGAPSFSGQGGVWWPPSTGVIYARRVS